MMFVRRGHCGRAVLLLMTVLAVTASAASKFSFHVHDLREITDSNSACTSCANLGSQALDALFVAILDKGVFGTCDALCANLSTPGQVKACDVACDAAGIDAFYKAVQNHDLDIVFFCEKIKLCPEGLDDADASLDNAVVYPKSGPKGTTFEFQIDFTVVNTTGAGSLTMTIQGDQVDLADTYYNAGFQPGTYSTNVTVQAIDDTEEDVPTVWGPGEDYEWTFSLCQGSCGSSKPHTMAFGSFTDMLTISEE